MSVIRDGAWQRLRGHSSRAAKTHNVTKAALEDCLCIPPFSPIEHNCPMLAKLCQSVQARQEPPISRSYHQLNSSLLLFLCLFSHFQHAMKAYSWENAQSGTCYTYSRLHTFFFPNQDKSSSSALTLQFSPGGGLSHCLAYLFPSGFIFFSAQAANG